MHPINKLPDLFRYGSRPAIIINLITMYRIVMFPVLLVLLFLDQIQAFKWLLLFSLLSDLIDGVLARKYKATSLLGAHLDSIGDDLTVLVGTIGVFYYRFDFMMENLYFILGLLSMYLIQLVYALIKYGRMTTFHTIMAKLAVFFQGMFICSAFFFKEVSEILFFSAVIVTALDIIEEIMLIWILKTWEANVKGIYWVLRREKTAESGADPDISG
jgi:CDP-diacylglycerol--glycerol-3-phosphate 3-phosphatidyltransferase